MPLAWLVNAPFTCSHFPYKLIKIDKDHPYLKERFETCRTKTKANFGSFKFCKIIEIAMYHRLYGYLEDIKRLYKPVFGFREQSSTSHVLISITESIRQSIDNTEFGWGILIDLRKRFRYS